jgi:hypothetical protein
MRKKQKYSNFFGDTDINPFYFLVAAGAVIYIASKGVGKITKSKNTLTNTALVIGGLIVYAKIKANQPED